MQIASLVIAGLISVTLMMIYFLLRRRMREEVARLRAELTLALAGDKPVRASGETRLPDEIHHRMHDDGLHQLTPQALSEVAVTLSAFLGRDVRISAVADGPAPIAANHSWAQQGCVAIQNSHDLSTMKQELRRPSMPVRPPVSVRRNVA